MLLAFCIDQRVKLQLVLFVACANCKKKEKKKKEHLKHHVIIPITKLAFVVFRHSSFSHVWIMLYAYVAWYKYKLFTDDLTVAHEY